MDIIDSYIGNIKKDLNIISYKIDTSIPDGYGSLFYILIVIFILFITLYDNPYWSYILLLLLLFSFLSIYVNKDFNNINLMKIFLNSTIKPVCLFYLIVEKSITPLLKEVSFKNLVLFGGLCGLISIFIFIGYIIINNQIICKYDLNKIKKNNELLFNNDTLSTTGENECTKLDLDKCYTLEELQPCFNQIKNIYNKDTNKITTQDCNYCLDYSYTKQECSIFGDKDTCMNNQYCKFDDETNKCSNKTCKEMYEDEDDCNNNNNCFYDSDNKECKNITDDSSKRLCLGDNDKNYSDKENECKENNTEKKCNENAVCNWDGTNCKPNTLIKCKSKEYCANKLDIKYCHQMPKFSTYNTVYVITYIISCVIIYYYYSKKCISDKSFILMILLVNILCLVLFIFLQNIGIDDNGTSQKLIDSAEFS